MQCNQDGTMNRDRSMEKTTSRRVVQRVTQTENAVPSNLEMYSSSRPQVVSGSIKEETMGPMSIVYLPIHETQLIGPPGYTNYPTEAPSPYGGSEGGYYGYQESGPSHYHGRNYPNYASGVPPGDGTYG